MKRVLAVLCLLVVAAPAAAESMCELAEFYRWISPALNTACVIEWMFQLMGGWTI